MRLKNVYTYVLNNEIKFSDEVKGFDVVIKSNVPIGSGLSSSAALEVSMFTFLEALTGNTIEYVLLYKINVHFLL